MLGEINNVVNTLSQEFKDLYIKMISKNEEDRPSIENILNDVWFNEISNLNPQQQMALDNEVHTQFLQKEQECNDIFEINPNLLEQFETFPTDNRYMNFIKRKPTFEIYYKPLYKKIVFVKDNHYIKLKGKLDHCYFMNELIDNIIKECGEDIVEVNASSYKYKCDLDFVENNDKEENNNDDNEEEEDKEESNENKCTIQLKLYQTGEEEFCLRFLRKLGNLPQYYLIIKKIFVLARNII